MPSPLHTGSEVHFASGSWNPPPMTSLPFAHRGSLLSPLSIAPPQHSSRPLRRNSLAYGETDEYV